MAIFAPWLMLAIISRKARGIPRHFQPHVEAFLHAEFLLHFRERLFRGVDGQRHAHLARQLQPVRIFVGNHHVARGRRARTTAAPSSRWARRR